MKHLLFAILALCVLLPPRSFAAEQDPFLVALSSASDGSPEECDCDELETLLEAAEQGEAEAQNRLGRIYAFGAGVPADRKEAAKWFRMAADRGFAEAQFNLGCCCEYGRGVRMDEGKAAELYRKAAEQGCAPAQFQYAFCLERGKGALADKYAAVEWYRKAAEQGHVNAQVNLALCYERGFGAEEDRNLARKWLRQAAEQGDETGREKLLLLDDDVVCLVMHHPSIVHPCGICGKVIDPIFAVDDFNGDDFFLCSECLKIPHCEYCRVPAVVNGDGVILCRDCADAAVEDPTVADSIFAEVRLSLREEFGVDPKRAFVCELGTRDGLGLLAEDDPQKMSILEEAVDGVSRRTVRILTGLPYDVFRIAAAEAIAQAWLEENAPAALDNPDIRDGFGLYVAWTFTKGEMLRRTKKMRNRLAEDGRFKAVAKLLRNEKDVSNWRKYFRAEAKSESMKMPVKAKTDDKTALKRLDTLKRVENEEREQRKAAARALIHHQGLPETPRLPPSPSNREDDLSNSQTLLRNGLRREHQVEQPPPSSGREDDLSRTQTLLRNGLRRE